MGNFLDKPETCKSFDCRQGNDLACGVASMQGWRREMEDAHCAIIGLPDHPDTSLFGVFDGHGGASIAQAAALDFGAVLTSIPGYKAASSAQEWSEVLYKAMLKIDALLRKRLYRPSVEHAGSTAVVALITPRDVLVANTGDSRAVLCRAGRAVAMSEDHKPDTPSERRRIQRAGLMVANGRVNGELAVSRALGDYEYKGRSDLEAEAQAVTAAPDVRSLPRHPSDELLVLACDGIWDVMSSEEGVGFAREAVKGNSKKSSAAARKYLNAGSGKSSILPAGMAAASPAAAPLARGASVMLDHCLDLGSRDNMTLAIVSLGTKTDRSTFASSARTGLVRAGDVAVPAPARRGSGDYHRSGQSRPGGVDNALDAEDTGDGRIGKGRAIAPSPLTVTDDSRYHQSVGLSRGRGIQKRNSDRASARPRRRGTAGGQRRSGQRPRTQHAVAVGDTRGAPSRSRQPMAAVESAAVSREPTWSFTPGSESNRDQTGFIHGGYPSFSRAAETQMGQIIGQNAPYSVGVSPGNRDGGMPQRAGLGMGAWHGDGMQSSANQYGPDRNDLGPAAGRPAPLGGLIGAPGRQRQQRTVRSASVAAQGRQRRVCVGGPPGMKTDASYYPSSSPYASRLGKRHPRGRHGANDSGGDAASRRRAGSAAPRVQSKELSHAHIMYAYDTEQGSGRVAALRGGVGGGVDDFEKFFGGGDLGQHPVSAGHRYGVRAASPALSAANYARFYAASAAPAPYDDTSLPPLLRRYIQQDYRRYGQVSHAGYQDRPGIGLGALLPRDNSLRFEAKRKASYGIESAPTMAELLDGTAAGNGGYLASRGGLDRASPSGWANDPSRAQPARRAQFRPLEFASSPAVGAAVGGRREEARGRELSWYLRSSAGGHGNGGGTALVRGDNDDGGRRGPGLRWNGGGGGSMPPSPVPPSHDPMHTESQLEARSGSFSHGARGRAAGRYASGSVAAGAPVGAGRIGGVAGLLPGARYDAGARAVAGDQQPRIRRSVGWQ